MSEPELTEATNQQPAKRLAAFTAHPAPICLLLAIVTFAVFWPLHNCDYLYLDDPTYTTSNPHVRQGLTWDGTLWAFGTGYASNWHPLTWLSHMLDAQLFGLNPAGPHMVNLLLHIANTLLLFVVLRNLTGAHWRSAFVAALFALHPLHVESVAWIAERKDVLSTFFWLLTIWAYARYAGGRGEREERKERGERREGGVCGTRSDAPYAGHAPHASHASLDYLLALLFFALGLMSKPMLVTLPFVLLLLDYWPLHRLQLPSAISRLAINPVGPTCRSAGTRGSASLPGSWPVSGSQINKGFSTNLRLLREKIPFFTLAALSCVVTLFAQNRALGSLTNFPLSVRMENALVSYARYLGKTFWPGDLALPYPHPGHWPLSSVVFAATLLAAASGGALWLGRRMGFVVTGWFWFLGTLVPVIGIVQVGIQSMADRYTYVPLIGIFILLVWGAEAVVTRWRVPQAVAAATGALVVGICAMQTAGQLGYWHNSETLFRHTIAVTKDNPFAYNNLGYYLYNHGHWNEAIENYHHALRINAADYVAYDNLGFCFYNQGRLDEAITNYHQALQINPNDPNTLNNLGTALTSRKEYDGAIRCFEAALRARPDYPDAHNNLGVVLNEVGKTGEAIRHYLQALSLAPDDAQAHNNLANALLGQGKTDEAIDHYRQALRFDPNLTQALNNLGWALAGQSRFGEAIACYQRALQLKPEDATLHKNLGRILVRMDRTDEAVSHYTESLRLAPDDVEAHFELGSVLAQNGRRDEAAAHFREALRLRPDHAPAREALQKLDAPAPK